MHQVHHFVYHHTVRDHPKNRFQLRTAFFGQFSLCYGLGKHSVQRCFYLRPVGRMVYFFLDSPGFGAFQKIRFDEARVQNEIHHLAKIIVFVDFP